MSDSYGFVILHYLAKEVTIKSVDKLLENFSSLNIHIVVVDNASPNKSGVDLLNRYEANENVDIILNEKNLGFAQGNNVGYDFLKKEYDPDFIIVMNNDVIIEQSDFLTSVNEIYAANHFFVLGPDIYNPNTQTHQNPAHIEPLTKTDLINMRKNLDKSEGVVRISILAKKILKFFNPFTAQKCTNENKSYKKEQSNVILHGACYIFSKEFIMSREYCFFPGTFLYMEEDILHFECMLSDYKILYSPKLQVVHLEDVSTDMALGSEAKKKLFKNREMIKSINVFLDLMDANEKL